ncbi:Centaurin-gamma-1A [Operophtera brumata]|uniref:Centaurin-gamma-1A n=1 Tax=Operophtera brumata TaxID=104452 RepID=A0A0L7KY54_OPEBR|nr:Centaurin-gamma-1A [Operophtera brumata]
MLSYRGTMCTRQHSQACLNTSLSIRQEIQRFESVHPSIYALYDLVEMVPDPLLAQQIRDHVVAIEGFGLTPTFQGQDLPVLMQTHDANCEI